jgi:histone acetyltransferase (RNA polymerase elongator complex component)
VAFYGGNFMGLPASYRAALLEKAEAFVSQGTVNGIRFSTRPDTISFSSMTTWDRYSVQTVELGVQSMDDAVLLQSRRAHTERDVHRAVEHLKSRGYAVGIQIMPGLPGDTRVSIMETGNKVVALQPDFVRIYPTVVIKDTVLEQWFRSGKYEPLSLNQAVQTTKALFLLFQKHRIPVIRMGLQASDNLMKSGNVVAGPFHPAFGHLVYSAVFLDLADQALKSQQRLSNTVTLMVSPYDVPKMVGQHKENIKRLVRRFDLDDIRVVGHPTVLENTVRVKSP